MYDISAFLCIATPNATFRSVKQRQHDLIVAFIHEEHAFVDERFPITISVTNMDTLELDIVVDLLLQPSEDDSSEAFVR